MKRIVNVFIICILTIALVGCGGNANEHESQAKTPSGSIIQKGKDYQDVISDFEEEGFVNIKMELLDDLITGWVTKDGEVESVSVDGDEDYSPDVWYPNDVEVIITYHTFPVTEEDKVGEIKETPEAKEIAETPDDTETNQTKVSDTEKLSVEPLDLNAINNTNSAESDADFVGKYYSITGIVDQAMEPSDGWNALVIIQPNVMAKGMGTTLPLEINIWLTADEFNTIGGISSVGKQISISARLATIGRNAMSKDPAVKGYPVQLEFGEYD